MRNLYIILAIVLSIYLVKKYYNKKKPKQSSFWNNMPVVHNYANYPTDFQIINPGYGLEPLSPEFLDGIHPLTKDYIPQILDFLNKNYINGYRFCEDYLSRKMEIGGAIGLLYISNAKIGGFIYSCPYNWRGKTFGYVDLMCVDKSIRGKGLAQKLITNITYKSPNKIYLHKKDEQPLPFEHFHSTSHYSCGVAYLKRKYNVSGESLYKPLEDYGFLAKKTGQDQSIFRTSESIKTYSNGKCHFSIAIFKFSTGIVTTRIAELFYVEEDFIDYVELIKVLDQNRIDFLVVLPVGIFKNKIDLDYYTKSMDLYLYSFNIVVKPIEMNICMP